MTADNDNRSARKLPGFRHVLEAALFFGALGGLADVSYIFTRNPDLIADLMGGLRFLTAGVALSTFALIPFLLIVLLVLRPIAGARKWPLDLSLAILFMFAAFPFGAIIARNYALMVAESSIIVAQVKVLFYFLKYLWVVVPVSWATGVWLAKVRTGTTDEILFARLSGIAISAAVFMVLTPLLQQKWLLARANEASEVNSSLENVLISLGVFILALILLPLLILISSRIVKIKGGLVLVILWIVGMIFPYIPPLMFGPPLTGTPPSGAELSGRPSNVMLVSLDTVRYDDMGFCGSEIVETPTFDALARDGVIFDNAITPMPMTGPAHMSMLTGLQPDSSIGHGVKSNGISLPDNIPTLATILDEAGYNTGAIIGGFPLSRQASGIERGFHHFHDVFNEGFRARFLPDQVWYLTPAKILKKVFNIREGLPHGRRKIAEDVTDQALDWLNRNSDDPFFLFVHYFDAHYLYAPPAPFDTEYMPEYDGPYKDRAVAYVDLVKNIESMTEADHDYYRALYRGEISYMDAQFKRIVDWGNENGIWDNTLLIVVSDHGEGFEHNYYFNHTDRVYDQLILVPMMIADPDVLSSGTGGEHIDRLVNVSDIYFTVLDFLNIDSPDTPDSMNRGVAGSRSGWDHNLMGMTDDPDSGWNFVPSQSYSFAAPGELALGRFFTFRYPDWKLIYGPDAEPHLPMYQYFDLNDDPEEMNDIFPGINWWEHDASNTPEALALWASRQGLSDIVGMDDVTRAELKALGYIDEGP